MARSRLEKLVTIYLLFALVFISASAGYITKDYIDSKTVQKTYDLSDIYAQKSYKGVPLILATSDPANYSGILSGSSYNDAAAVYLTESDAIVIFTDRLTYTAEDLYVLYHEYGHHLWYHVMDSGDREKYAKVYRQSGGFVSNYAMQGGVTEDFAESYMLFMVNPERVPKEKKDFISSMRAKHIEFY